MVAHSLAVRSFGSIAQPWASRCAEIRDHSYASTREAMSTALISWVLTAPFIPLPPLPAWRLLRGFDHAADVHDLRRIELLERRLIGLAAPARPKSSPLRISSLTM